ncbi:MAG: Flp pilus assembly complex ATPase component TadA [Clostridia bacterium]|nr:Flp pilus assembly complex ATPase component TadA [Clostridia bacterium]
MENIRIGEILVGYGYITEEQLEFALGLQKQDRRKRLADLLVELGYISEEQKLKALAKRLGLPLLQLDNFSVHLPAVEKLPKAYAIKHQMIPVDIVDGKLLVACTDPLDFFGIEEVRQVSQMPLELALTFEASMKRAIEYYYSEVLARSAASSANQNAGKIDAPGLDLGLAGAEADDAPVVKLLNSLLLRGYNINASDIHVEPFENNTNIRMRVDGTIVDFVTLDSSLHQPLIARIKILANLNIAEKRLPQDGHFRIVLDGTDINLRVAVLPTVYGEKAVLRLLNTNAKIDNDLTFGMNKANYAKMSNMLKLPHGIIFLTGPTGSGKTTTLYMVLRELVQRSVNISTVEDPVEKNIARVNQTQINPPAGLTFETGLRSILRQDPDIIMVGETRDSETARIAVRAAITGHLVLSTLHTNDATSAIVRLEDMGVQRHLIANSLVGLLAQRLVKKICPDCAYEYEADEWEKAALGYGVTGKLRRGRGCHMCNNTGYRGRIAIHEMLVIDKEIRHMISKGATPDEIEEYAIRNQGMTLLREAAADLVKTGVTTVDELHKAAYYV